MPNSEAQGTCDALIVFADVIDSSKFSAVLSYEEYAGRIRTFQQAFEALGERYFPSGPTNVDAYVEVKARGDEGIIFVVDPTEEPCDLVLRAVDLLFHLKGRLRLLGSARDGDATAPQRIAVGAGIHFGRVAYFTKVEAGRSVISQLEGYAINYAKRVETCSRYGSMSRVLLSEGAAQLVHDAAIILDRLSADMKGIAQVADVYEIRSALLSGIHYDANDSDDEALAQRVEDLAEHPDAIDEPWLKALSVSLLDCLMRRSALPARKAAYHALQVKLAWHSPTERDPILLYLRARGRGDEGRYTEQVHYLRTLAEAYPDFLHVRMRMVEALWHLLENDPERPEKIYAVDMAREFLERFPHYLSEEQKKAFTAIADASGLD